MASNGLRFLGDGDRDIACNCDILDKKAGIWDYLMYMFDRTSSMFEYDNLPKTIPAYLLEFILQWQGYAILAEYKGEHYVFMAKAGGPLDVYYRPTQAVVANPALGLSETFKIVNNFPPFDKTVWSAMRPCVVIRNDSQERGLLPMYRRYATQLVENEISLRSAQINARQQSLISASTSSEIASATRYIADLEAGKLSCVAEAPFLDGIKAQNVSTTSANSIIQLIELQQYLKAAWFNDIGLNANFNMKREYLSSEEIAANTDVLLPLADDMLRCREDAISAVNETFGLNISVKKGSSWDKKVREVEASLQQEENAAETSNAPEVSSNE